MYFDLNIPIAPPATLKYNNSSKKKGKQNALAGEAVVPPTIELFSATQVEAIEKRIEVLVHRKGCSLHSTASYDTLSGL